MPWIDPNGYLAMWVTENGRRVSRQVHRLVCEEVHGPCPPGKECRHLNGDKLDNRPENLVWGTRSENMLDRVRHGTHHGARRTHCRCGQPLVRRNPRAKQRICRSCTARNERAYRQRKKEMGNASRG